MTSQGIRLKKACIQSRLSEAEKLKKIAMLELQILQQDCPHENKQSWTNNDGDGQFKVERCLDCGLQKDGGLT
jgi:ferredoxin-like protein FixX